MNQERMEQLERPIDSSQSSVSSTQAVLQARREGIHRRLREGASGTEVVSDFTALVDTVLIGRYRNVVRQWGGDAPSGMQHCCLVAVGGYGRRELAPYSDIDVMMLYRTGGGKVVQDLSKKVFHHLWDLGFQVGHSVRSIRDCVVVAEEDLSAKTALMESRFLVGSPSVFQGFRRRFAKRVLGRRVENFVREKLEEREQDYAKFGETVFLLEPNIKRTKGGLRDVHLLQWIGMARYQASTLQELVDRGALVYQDYTALLEAREFLFKVRALLHLGADRAQEILSFDEQVRMAQEFGYRDEPHMLGVEQFMQHYYRLTTGIHHRAMRFVERAGSTSLWTRLKKLWPSPVIDGFFQVVDGRLSIHDEKLMQVLDDPEHLLSLFQVAQKQGVTIDGLVLEEIHRHMESIPDHLFASPAVSRRFRELLSGPEAVAETLTLMHQARVLEKLIPAFGRVRGLMQFNQYHKYTVDEHSLLAVKKVEFLGKQSGTLGRVYEEIQEKDLLHLAVLLHDVGKGLPEDHSEVGKRIAQDVSVRLELDAQESRTLEFLVHEHLLMANTAFRRDPHDEKVRLTFCRAVGSPERLKQLLLLTAADIAAVGPDMLTRWKEALLIELYLLALPEVSGESEQVESALHIERVTDEVLAVCQSKAQRVEAGGQAAESQALLNREWVKSQLEAFPVRYLSGTSKDRIIAHLSAIQSLTPERPRIESTYNRELKVCEYSLIAFDSVSSGMFMKMTGVLAAKGLRVLDAQIVTRPDGIVVDTFLVKDPDFSGEPTPARLEKVGKAIVSVLKAELSIEAFMEQNQRVSFRSQMPIRQHRTEVKIDNETSDQFTVIDVFADDKQGLLHEIAKTLYDLGLSVHSAKIGTRLDQVVDVFHVTERNGNKVEDARTCELIQTRLQEQVDRFLQN